MSSLFHKHLWKFREGGEKNTFGKKYHRMQVKDLFSELLLLLFLLVLILFPELGCCTTWWENQVKVRLAYCWMWKMADLKLFLGKSSSIGDYLLPPLSLFPCPKTKANWSNRYKWRLEDDKDKLWLNFKQVMHKLYPPQLVLPPQLWQNQTQRCSRDSSAVFCQTLIAQAPFLASPSPLEGD